MSNKPIPVSAVFEAVAAVGLTLVGVWWLVNGSDFKSTAEKALRTDVRGGLR